MANPSTIWAQLSIPNPPAGSVPFVAADGITIVTDVPNFFYNPSTHQLGLAYQITFGYTNNATPGNTVTNNSPAGRVVMAAGASTLVVNNNLITANSLVLVSMESTDATATFVKAVQIVPVSLQFQIIVNAAATSSVKFSYLLVG